ncbi:MAG: ribonuclease H-like domain-containing protein, partial [Burkholderiales bacterium]
GAPASHQDLMTMARRLWYRPLGTYRLAAIEQQALGHHRIDDIPSAEIPGLYLQYLRSGDAELLDPVFAHNRQDVLCLLHLRRRTRRWIEEGEDPPPPIDWEGLGVLRMQIDDSAGAEGALRRALQVEHEPAVRWRVACRLARLLRRAARWEELLTLWERDTGCRGSWRVRALIETAKVHQHRLKQSHRAIAALEEASAIVEWLFMRDDPMASVLEEALRRRMTRLRVKTTREVSQASR